MNSTDKSDNVLEEIQAKTRKKLEDKLRLEKIANELHRLKDKSEDCNHLKKVVEKQVYDLVSDGLLDIECFNWTD